MGSSDSSSLWGFAIACGLVVAACLGLRVAFVEPRTDPAQALPEQPEASPPIQIEKSATAPPAKPAAKEPYRNGSTLWRTPDYWSDESIAALLESSSNLDVRGGNAGQTPLLYAVRKHDFDRVESLLDAGADPFLRDYMGHDAYGEIIGWQHKVYLREVKQVVDHVREPQNFEVIEIIQSGDEERFARWLGSGPNLEAHWDLRRTPLLWALYYDRGAFAAKLMARGARRDVVDYRGHTPLHFAAMNGNLRMVRELRVAGAQLDAANAYGQTPLALSIFAPDLKAMEELLSGGANPCIGPRGKSDALDLARTTKAGNEASAIRLLSPAVDKRSCAVSAEDARRANLRKFIARLKDLTPPPGFVLDPSTPPAAFESGDALQKSTQHYYRDREPPNSAEAHRRMEQDERATAYRALLAHPDDESFVWHGASIWRPDLVAEDFGVELAIEELLLKYLFYFQVDRKCRLCGPSEDIKGYRVSKLVLEHADHLARFGRFLEAVDISEKFIRERINETLEWGRVRLFTSRIRPLWLLGRHEEAYAVANAEYEREQNSPDGEKGSGSQLAKVIKAMDDASDDPERPTQHAMIPRSVVAH